MRISDWSSDVCSSDLVAAFAHPAQRVLDAVRNTPPAVPELVGQSQLAQLLQPGGAQRLLERVAVARAHDAVLVHVAHQPPVDRGQPLGTAILTQPRLDFEIGAWTQDRKSTRLNSSH